MPVRVVRTRVEEHSVGTLLTSFAAWRLVQMAGRGRGHESGRQFGLYWTAIWVFKKMRFTTVLVFAGLGFACPLAAAPKVDFQREVRPILSDGCFLCHGPDKSTRMVNLRLDIKDGAFATRKMGQVVAPGNSKKSLLYQRISATDGRKMPPEYSHKKLSAQQIDTLRRWIDEGAEWKEHWAYRAPVRPAEPVMKRGDWARNAIDRFVLAKIEERGLQPAREAGRRSLIRRVSLDLTGLPPTVEEVERFVNDSSPDAYEQLVDRLMASPRWGEHRGRYWLDAARYGDTHGIHIDNYRDIWPYRDWVIQAFNRNMPFDKFTIEQLAGDLLPEPTTEQRIATGFQRCNPTTNEAGVIIDEVEAMYAKDRADTVGAVWLGMTVGCATCHDHKFDAIKQTDFYALTAFFRNSTQHAMDGNISDTPPVVVVPAKEDRARWDTLAAREKELIREMAAVRSEADGKLASWAAGERKQAWGGELLALDLKGAIRVKRAEGMAAADFGEGVALGGSPWPGRMALHFDKKGVMELPGLAELEVKKAFSVGAWFYLPQGEESFTIVTMQDAKQKGRGWSFQVSGRVPGVRFYGDEGKSIEIRAGHLDQLTPGTWNHAAFSYDGTGEALGVRVFINGAEARTQRKATAKVEGDFANSGPLKLGNPGKAFDPGGAIADLRVVEGAAGAEQARLMMLWPVVEEARGRGLAELSADEREGLRLLYLLNEDAGYKRLIGELAALEPERRAIRRRGTVSLVMEERQDQKPFAHLLNRGMYDQPREKLDANTPSALPPMAAGLPRNRLGLAQWLMDEGNPVTARVTVNRFWQEVFGTGLVKTTDDFGAQGEPPANQELLDWLAVEFRESGWDVKKFFKLMVTSAAYRQEARATEEKLEKDPDNRLLSRGPRYRMDGEMLRDQALAASGLLAGGIGGPSVKPYQPAGVWEAVAMKESDTRIYKQDEGEALYRRSMYTLWKRSAPPASMDIFNAPSRETCTVRRERTNTPLQALVTMNDPQFVEAARVLAEGSMKAGGDVETRTGYMAARLLGRGLEEREKAVVRESYRAFLRHYDSAPDDARKLVGVGERKAAADVAVAELAALTMVANQLMNLDEVLVK